MLYVGVLTMVLTYSLWVLTALVSLLSVRHIKESEVFTLIKVQKCVKLKEGRSETTCFIVLLFPGILKFGRQGKIASLLFLMMFGEVTHICCLIH